MSVLSKLLASQKPDAGTIWENYALPTLGNASDQYGSIAGDNGKYVAVAGRGSVVSNAAAFSTNGFNWSPIVLNNTQFAYDVAFGKDNNNQDLFVIPVYNDNSVLWSRTGSSFTGKSIFSLIGPGTHNTIAYGNGRWVILANDSTRSVHSNNPTAGNGWSLNNTLTVQKWNKVRFGNNIFLAISLSNNFAHTIASATQFNNWTNKVFNIAPNIPSPPQWRDAAYGDGKWVIVGHTTSASPTDLAIYGDPIANTWQVAILPAQAQWASIVYTGKFFVAKAYGGPTAVSTNGINWVAVSSVPNQGANFTRMIYAPNDNKLLTTGFGGTNNNVWVSLPSSYNY
jgi:hypothetical protein